MTTTNYDFTVAVDEEFGGSSAECLVLFGGLSRG